MRGQRRDWRAWWKPGSVVILLSALALNSLAWQQAWAMTHYTSAGAPPPTIEALSWREKVRVLLLGLAVARPRNQHTPRDVGLSYTVQRITIPDSGSVETWVIDQLQPRGVVILFPGYASSKDSLLAPAATLHARGYATVLVDFRGTGGSTGDDTTLGVREATDVAAVFADAQRSWPGRPIVLYGVSMGSAAVLHAIATYGIRPAAIILESPFDRLLGTVATRFHAFGLPATPAAELLVFWGSVQQRHNGFAFNPAADARAVTCPALVLHGDADPRATTAQTTAVYTGLGNVKTFATFPGAGHALLAATAPQEWEQVVARFLASNDAAP
jgi:uncharacterized protein